MEHELKLMPHNEKPPAVGGAVDPVCGMKVDIATARHVSEHHHQSYYFCSAGCKTKFQANPAKYLDAGEKVTEPVVAGTIYTCPMHPQIRQVGPRHLSHLRHGPGTGDGDSRQWPQS